MRAVILASEGHEPNDIILPSDIDEVVWGTIAFVILVFVLWKLAYEPLKKAMADKRERIAAEIDEAESARVEAETELEGVRSSLANADADRVAIIEEARRTATALAGDLEQRSQAEVVALRERAQRDIAASQQQALADLEATIGDLTLGAAEAVVQNVLDEATHAELIERYIAELGSRKN